MPPLRAVVLVVVKLSSHGGGVFGKGRLAVQESLPRLPVVPLASGAGHELGWSETILILDDSDQQ